MKTVTQWFGMDVPPDHDGVYQVINQAASVFYARWYRGLWRITSRSPESAACYELISDCCYNGSVTGWRGHVAVQPVVDMVVAVDIYGPEYVERQARVSYENTYHKSRADIGFDLWLRVWKKAFDSLPRAPQHPSPPVEAQLSVSTSQLPE